MSNEVIIILGSNLGDRDIYLSEAIKELKSRVGTVLKRSAVYESESWGYVDDKNYFNQVLIINTELGPVQVLQECLAIEKRHGRTRSAKGYQARTLDIDILFYGNEIFNSDELTLPHPKIAERCFVLVPLNEVIPDKIHPIQKVSIRELLANCTDSSSVVRRE